MHGVQRTTKKMRSSISNQPKTTAIMTKQFIYTSAVTALLASGLASCSSDDAIDNEIAENKLAPITMTVGTDEEISDNTLTRTSITFTGGIELSGTQNVWEGNDVVWAYSTSKNFFNKLKADNKAGDKYHDKELDFSSDGEVSYTADERLVLFNCGDNSGNTNLTNDEKYNIKLTRNNDDNLMVSVYGGGEDGRTYTDEGNAFSLRRVSAVVKDDGKLYKTSTSKNASTSSFQNTASKVYFYMPAKSIEDAEKLAKLTYKIIISVADAEENEGYPKSVSFKFDNTLSTKTSDNEKVFDTKTGAVTEWGEALKVKFTPNGSDLRHMSSAIWNTTSGADDELQGMVFFLLPPNVYTKVSVKVRVEAPANENIDEDIKALCKTYSYTFAPEEDSYYDNSDPNLKSTNGFTTEKLGAIWNRTNSSAKPFGFFASSGASTGWVVTEND